MNALESTSVPSIDATFALIDEEVKIVDESRVRGKHTLIVFGFTHYRVVCPLALGKLTRVLDRLKPRARTVQPLDITVDPERDTSDVLRAFLNNQYPRFIGLTGSREQLDHAKRALRMFAQRRDEGVDDYVVPHSTLTSVLVPPGD